MSEHALNEFARVGVVGLITAGPKVHRAGNGLSMVLAKCYYRRKEAFASDTLVVLGTGAGYVERFLCHFESHTVSYCHAEG